MNINEYTRLKAKGRIRLERTQKVPLQMIVWTKVTIADDEGNVTTQEIGEEVTRAPFAKMKQEYVAFLNDFDAVRDAP